MKVTTYNIKVATATSLDTIATVLGSLDADLVALQEVGRHWQYGEGANQAAVLADTVGYPHALFCPALGAGRPPLFTSARSTSPLWARETLPDAPPEFGIALLSRLGISHVTRHVLPRVADEQRVALVATVTGDEGPLTVVTTHLSIDARDRLLQAKALVGIIKAIEGPLLLMGDLNDELDGASLAPLEQVFYGAEPPVAPTFPVPHAVETLDHILPRELDLDGPPTPLMAPGSDHYPVVAIVS